MEISCTRWEAHVHWFPITVVVTHTLSVTPDLFMVPQKALSVSNRKEDVVECEAAWLEEDVFFTKLIQRMTPLGISQNEGFAYLWVKLWSFKRELVCFLSFFEAAKLTTEYLVWIVCVLKLRRTNSKHETRIFTARNKVGARLCFHRHVWFCSQAGCLPQCMLGYHNPP